MTSKTLTGLEQQASNLKSELARVENLAQVEADKLKITAQAVLAEAAANPTYKGQLMKILDKHVTGRGDREVLGLDQKHLDHTITGD